MSVKKDENADHADDAPHDKDDASEGGDATEPASKKRKGVDELPFDNKGESSDVSLGLVDSDFEL